jgi:hypothetical protein
VDGREEEGRKKDVGGRVRGVRELEIIILSSYYY